jgi:hypothetical protein
MCEFILAEIDQFLNLLQLLSVNMSNDNEKFQNQKEILVFLIIQF